MIEPSKPKLGLLAAPVWPECIGVYEVVELSREIAKTAGIAKK